MRKSLKFILSAVFMVSVMAGTAMAVDHGHEFIDLNAQHDHSDVIHVKDKKWVPHFPHRLHQEKYLKGHEDAGQFKYTDDWTCSGCHHKSEKGHQPVACLKCKDVKKMLHKVKAKDNGKKFENMYHNNCRDACHKTLAKRDKGAWGHLKKCKTCHKSKPGKPYKYPAKH